MERKIGIIGLGRMGKPLSETLRRKGFDPILTTRTAAVRDEMRNAGFEGRDSPRELAAEVDVIIISVFDSAAVANVLEAPDGILDNLTPGTLVIDMGTTGVMDTLRFAAIIRERSGVWVDAPVSGGTRGAAAGTLAIMAGGTDEAIERARPVLEAAGRLTHMGATGAGQATKAANQLILGATLLGVAEGLALAARAGVDPAKAREAMMGGFADSRVLTEHGKRMIEAHFEPGGSIAVFHKDLRQVVDYADQNNMAFPGLCTTELAYRNAFSQGMAGLDQSAIIKLYERPDHFQPEKQIIV
jgi:3-hydroxyisobutyrate dehydrogenase-like beta-hydroxyacid dehydrogenase